MVRPSRYLIVLLAAGCGSGGGGAAVDGAAVDAAAPGDGAVERAPIDPAPAEEFFRPDVVHRVDVVVEAAAWQMYLQEHHTFIPDRQAVWFRADTVNIDGTTLANVAFHSFGWGSRDENRDKPNFSLDFDRNVPGQSLRGIQRMRLKNNGQDVTGLRQTLLYEAARAAKLMAPRSSFAQLTVNGQAMGVYTLEETFSPRFVRERTGNDDGPAYEPRGCQGLLAPAGGCERIVDHFTRPFNTMVGGGQDLVALCRVVNGPPEQFLAAVAPLIDLQEWVDQIALDTALAGNFDGFSVTGGNFRLYHDTARDKLRLLVIGPDDTFVPDRLPEPDPLHPKPRDGCTRSNPQFRDIFLERLLATPDGLAMYRQSVRKLRTGVMAADRLKQRANALWSIVGPLVESEPLRVDYMEPEQRKGEIGSYIDERWAALEAAGL